MSGAVSATAVAATATDVGVAAAAAAAGDIGAAGLVEGGIGLTEVGAASAVAGGAGLGATALGVLNSPVGAAAAGSVVSSVLGSLSRPKVGQPPSLATTVPAMPLANQQDVLAAQRRQIAIQTANQGRAGTILTSPASQTLG